MRSKTMLSTHTRMEGYFNKWTNYAEGYKKRWFVLEEGILSYYKSQAEYPVNCRGSVNMQYARVHRHEHDKLRFEVIPASNGSQKIHVRADNVVEAQKWIIALNQASVASTSSADLAEPTPVPEVKPLDLEAAEALHVDLVKKALHDLSELEILLNQHLNPAIGADPPPLTVGNTLNLVFMIREALLSSDERENLWRRRWNFEKTQKELLEDSFKTLAMENTRIENYTRLKAREEAKGKIFVERDVSIDTVADEFYDAIEDIVEVEEEIGLPKVSATKAEEVDLEFISKDLVGYSSELRKEIPCDSSLMPPVSLWSILKNAIGKDLSRIPIPVNYSEPVSMLQRLCEEMEYSELLDLAYASEDPLLRIQYVAAFAASAYASTEGRITKPFNPLMGETFEYVSAEKGFRYVSEQVSHHPPISACHCESARYVMWAEVNVSSKFWGKSMELTPEGLTHLILKGADGRPDEHYSWKKVKTVVNNIVVGKLWIDHHGLMIINSHQSGVTCELDFKATGWRTVEPKRVEGRVLDAQGNVTHTIDGFWNSRLTSHDQDGNSIELWRRRPLPPSAPKMYTFTAFTMTLNQLPPTLTPHLCPTDSRFRPDQRAMEEGDFTGANELKVMLEEKQRSARKLAEVQGGCFKPRWFGPGADGDTGAKHWEFRGEYWSARESGNWEAVPSIFLQ